MTNLIVTDKAAVDAAFEEARPRPIRDIMMEIYPEATEDANGRFHAPHDGYLCPITDREFRAGEFLPQEEVDDPFAATFYGRAVRMPEARDLEGNLHRWEGSAAQRRAVWPLLIAQTKAHDATVSNHVGEVGAMTNLENLTLQFVKGFDGFYGTVWIHIFKDPQGNVVVYKGSKRIRTGPNPHLDSDLHKGGKVSLRCKIKEHGERDGVKQTVVQRPKVIKP
ncbi:hypothetical protein [Roseobacter phage RDJL6]|nr:hypothetical protein [Roseobacter phage RDJL6]